MKRKFTFLIAAMALLMVLIIPNGMWGQTRDEITWTASAQGYANQQAITNVDFDSNVSATFNKGTNSNAPKYYTSGTAIRCYGGNYFTISSESTLTSIVISFGSSDGSNAITTDVGTYSSGTWTGSTNSVTFTIGGTFGNRRIAGFTITYSSGGTPTVSTPTISPDGGIFLTSQEVSISCATDGAKIYYTTDGNDPTISSTAYADPFTITETSTVKAFAVKSGYNDSNIATAEFTKATPMTIAEVREQGTGNVFTTGIVTSCSGATGYIQDETAAICVYGESLTVGDEITVSGTLTTYSGLLEITNPVVSVISSGNPVEPDEMTIEEINASSNQGWLIRVENATVTDISGKNVTLAQDENTVVARFNNEDDITFAVNDVVSMTANIGCYSNNVQLANPTDIEVQTTPVINAENIEIAYDAIQGEIIYTISNPTDATLTATTTADWVSGITVTETNVTFTTTTNDGNEDRVATFTLSYTGAEDKEVTVTQGHYVAPTATITVASTEINVTAAKSNGTLDVSYENITEVNADVWFCNAEGTAAAEYDWITADINAQNNVEYLIEANTGEERTAYFKVYARDDDSNYVYSDLVTVTQAEFVVDYAELPFEFTGGKNDIANTVGLTQEGLGSDYSSSPKLKFDGTGDWLILKINETPGVLTFDIKGNGFSGGTFTVQTSADGETYTDLAAYTELGDTQSERFDDFDEDVRYIKWIYTNKSGGNVALGNIKLVKKYTITLNQPLYGEGTISVDKTEAAEGETVTLTATPNTGYAFTSWTVLDGEAQEVEVTENQFTMPASNVEVDAVFTALTIHDIVIPGAIEDNVVVDATDNQAYAGATVTIGVVAPDNKVLETLTVTGNTSSSSVEISPEVSAAVSEYTFTMPDEDVTINATFTAAATFTLTFSVNGEIDNNITISEITEGESVDLPASSDLTPDGFTLIGWAKEGSTTAVDDPYTPTADETLYAILNQEVAHSLTITTATENFPDEYGTANVFNEYTLEGKQFMIQQGYANGAKLQWRAAGHKNGTGTMYNNEDFGRITSIVLVYDDSDSNKNFTINAGATANPTEGTSINPTAVGNVYTFDLSNGEYNYFVMTNGDGAGYLTSIAIDYVASLNINTITEVTSEIERDSDIPATELVIVNNGAVLTLNGTNNGTADNLVIADGGQLLHTNAVKATVQKDVNAYTSKDGDGWYMIASPVDGLSTTVVTTGTYDLFAYDEETAYWHSNTGTLAPFATFERGKGYLYANSTDATLDFAGSMIGTEETIDIDLSYTLAQSDDLRGFNLMGNPFTRNLASGDLAIGATEVTAYYGINAATTDIISYNISENPIKPGQGFFIQADAESQTLTFNPVSSKDENKGYISIKVGNESSSDNAFIQIANGNTLRKMTLADNTQVYVMDGDKDYAAARVEELEGAMPVNFKAVADGEFTINVNAREIDAYYMHLIDNFTGADIDLLLEPSYTFNANAGDNENRFTLVFDFNNYTGVNESYANEIFAYQNGNDIVVNGEGILQVYDVMGRFVTSFEVNGSKRINASEFSNAVYIFRMTGNDVKTQKIVVR